MLEVLSGLKNGYNSCTQENGKFAFARMDTGVHILKKGENISFFDEQKETAFLLLTGEIGLKTTKGSYRAQRENIFKQKPYCLHVSRATNVEISADKDSEILIIKTTNTNTFEEVYYSAGDIEDRFLGADTWEGTAKRLIRDIFNYDNAPYSNLVVGEIIMPPGRWSSYTPHWHRQPEIYYYRFDKPQGFGCCFMDDNAYTIKDNSFAAIPGGMCHPQVTAPGYALYYTWIIRHLDNDPWNQRIMAPEHEWLNKENPDIIEIG